MKKYSFIALVVLTLTSLLAACVRLDLLPPEDFSDSPWAVDKTLPVPILFGQGDIFQIETKSGDAPIINASELEGKHFAVFSIAHDDGKSLSTDIGYISDDVPSQTDNPRLLLNGAFAKSVDGKVSFRNASDEMVTHYYYQPGNNDTKYNYMFMAYKILAEKASYTDSDLESLKVQLLDDGSRLRYGVYFDMNPEDNNVDVMYAYCPAPVDPLNGYYGYNAEYARQARVLGVLETHQPQFAFNHLASSVHIRVKVDGADDAARLTTVSSMLKKPGDANDFTISDINVKGIWSRALLSFTSQILTKTTTGANGNSSVNKYYAYDGDPVTPWVANSPGGHYFMDSNGFVLRQTVGAETLEYDPVHDVITSNGTGLPMDVSTPQLIPSSLGGNETIEGNVDLNTESNGLEYSTGFYIIPKRKNDSVSLSPDPTPDYTDSTPLTIQFTMTNQAGVPVTKSATLPWPAEGAYRAGYSYTYYITIKAPELIVITTSVSAYNEYTGSYETSEEIPI